MNAREEILARIERAVPGRPAAEVARSYARIERGYLRRHHDEPILELFAERVADYRATVRQVTATELPATIARALAAHAGRTRGTGSDASTGPGSAVFAVAAGFPEAWLAQVEATRLAVAPATAELDGMAGAVTGCAVAIAETGTIVLDHALGQGPRALSLVPDYHLIVVSADQIVADVPEALERLDPARPLTFVSGPSATSDIELSRVEGVHGPRTLEVIVTR